MRGDGCRESRKEGDMKQTGKHSCERAHNTRRYSLSQALLIHFESRRQEYCIISLMFRKKYPIHLSALTCSSLALSSNSDTQGPCVSRPAASFR